MGRLKKDHSGYSSHGKWLKYQFDSTGTPVTRVKSKKDTVHWCKGKVGAEHVWHKWQERQWDDELFKYAKTYVDILCKNCGKKKSIKTAKGAHYPLHAWIDDKSTGYEPVQVRVNGVYLPIDYIKYFEGKYFCRYCGMWHY